MGVEEQPPSSVTEASNSEIPIAVLSNTKAEQQAERKAEFKERKKADADIDHVMHTLPMRLYMAAIWLLTLAVMCFYIHKIANQYISNKITPSSSLSIQQVDSLPLPHVVICNWNQYQGPDFEGLEQCTYCNLSLTSCINFNDNTSCASSWSYIAVNTTGGWFNCYQFNNDPNNVQNSTGVGYAGSYATVWSINKPPATIPPTTRAGLQASYFWADNSSVDPAQIYAEYRFAPYNYDTFYAITWELTQHTEDNPPPDSEDQNYYSTTSSSVNLVVPSGLNSSYVGISFAFEKRNQQINQFFTSYSLENFWGDFAGMIGTLMGLDVIKVAAGIPITWLAFKMRTLVPISEHFNG